MNYLLIILLFFILIILYWALFSKEDKKEPDEKTSQPDALLRRRASDKIIEEEFPDDMKPRRRRSDYDSMEESTATGDEFKLPYLTDEIISDTSRYRIYRRTLFNAEIYAKKGDFATAMSLYNGVTSRISDIETSHKIEANIDYLNRYKDYISEKKKKEQSIDFESQKPSREVKFSLDGPLNIPDTIKIGITAPIEQQTHNILDVDRIVNEISRRLKENMELDGSQEPEDREKDASLKKEVDELSKKFESLAIGDSTVENVTVLKAEIEKLEAKLEELSSRERTIEHETILKAEIHKLEQKLDSLSSKETQDNDQLEHLNDVKQKVDDLEKQISELTSRKDIPEVDQKPTLIEAKYDSPIPVVLDPKPIMEILEKIPAQKIDGVSKTTPEPTADEIRTPEAKAKQDSGEADKPGEIQHTEEQKSEVITKHEEDEPDEWELLSKYGQEEKSPEEDLSDEDIFEKILHDDKPDEKQGYEIIGEQPEKTVESIYDIDDKEVEQKRREEERFYSKFLRDTKRVARELPILKVSYDFTKLPDEFNLAREKNILEFSYYKYKPMLEKANEFIKRRKVRDAINYYKVVMAQNLPPEFKAMIRKNINDLTEYLEKYLSSD